MADNCSRCGKSIGAWFGIPPANQEELQHLEELNFKPDGLLCNMCYHTLLDEAKRNPDQKVNNLTVSTINPYSPHEYENLGFISAHTALGTGPLNQLFAGVTDVLGQQSESYNRKMIEAEKNCLVSLKNKAHELGANEVVGVRTTYTELTKGHGMLLVCMTGTAIKTKEPSENI